MKSKPITFPRKLSTVTAVILAGGFGTRLQSGRFSKFPSAAQALEQLRPYLSVLDIGRLRPSAAAGHFGMKAFGTRRLSNSC